MSSLKYSPGMSGDFFTSAAEGWGPFTVFTRKVQRKEKKDVLIAEHARQAQTFEQERTLAQEQARSKALEDLRDKVAAKIDQLEAEASVTANLVLKIRDTAADPILAGDPILEELAQVLADMEKAVITIQAGTVVDVATFDTTELAGAYSDAQAALLAMRSLTARAQGVLKTLAGRIKELKDGQIRSQMLASQRQEQLAVEQRRLRQLEEQQQAAAVRADRNAAWQQKQALMSRIMEAQAELSHEKRLLSSARIELANLRFAREKAGL